MVRMLVLSDPDPQLLRQNLANLLCYLTFHTEEAEGRIASYVVSYSRRSLPATRAVFVQRVDAHRRCTRARVGLIM